MANDPLNGPLAALGRGGLVTFAVPTPPVPAVEKKIREKKPKIKAKNDPNSSPPRGKCATAGWSM